MGIPKYYRWLSERYPLLNQKFTATEGPPEMDNLYLDMNGIIHNCTHANQREVKLTEDEMMMRIFDYIDKLVQIIKPRKLLFMAIDGVAPRAKMNQQRSRRFKAAKERIELEEEKRQKGEAVGDNPFDSNCITPGTPFMARLGTHLRFFIRRKMSEDLLWQAPHVVFSGHEVPGEGEHKIMEYIRWEKKNPNYQPNQRHCLYGLDADLIMLSLVTHEPHFCLLREIVSYTGGNRGQPARETLDNPCAENFILFHIGLLREYLELEFKHIAVSFEPSGCPNVERVVDDFVLFCMLVGNDFLPALPTLDINEGALNNIMTIYKELLPAMGGYLTYAGDLDRRRLEQLLGRLADMEQQVLEERAKDAEFMESKRSRRGGGGRGGGAEAWVAPSRGGAAVGGRGGRGGGAGNGTAAANGAGSNGQGPAAAARQAAGPSGTGVGFGGPQARRAAAAATNGFAALAPPDEPEAAVGGASSEDELPALLPVDPAASVEEPAVAAPAPKEPLAAFFQVIGAVGPDLAVAIEEEEEVVAAAAAPVVVAEPTMMSKEARQMMLSGMGAEGLQMWKARWYQEKLECKTEADRRRVVESYLQGLHWVLEYYYRGVASWDWYFPFYYAPMASDMVDLESVTVRFTQGKPFNPYEQLLAVLPPASCALLPPAFQPLMLDPKSIIIDFYPTEFAVDMEGKRANWEGIVKVPFVDEARLLQAVAQVGASGLSAEEQERNKLGQILVFVYAPDSTDKDYCKSSMSQVFRDVTQPRSRLIRRQMPPPLPAHEKGFTPSLMPGTTTGLHAPKGFPTLKSVQVSAVLRSAGVNVLGTPSRKESLLLQLPDMTASASFTAANLAPRLLGKRCYVNWPYLQEAQMIRVSDASEQWYFTGHAALQCKKWQNQEASKWQADGGMMAAALLTKHGVEVGKVTVAIHVKVCKGFIRHLDGTVEKQYSQDEVTFPLQSVLRSRPGAAPSASDDQEGSDLPEPVTLKAGDRVVYLGKQHYGCVATILQDLGDGLGKDGNVLKRDRTYRISVQPVGPPNQDPAKQAAQRAISSHSPRWYTSSDAARKLKLNPRVLGRITSNVWLMDGEDRYDIGLSVRAPSKGLCVPNFAAPSQDGGWMYSEALVKLLAEYQAAHSWVFQGLLKQANAADGDTGGSLRSSDMLPELSTADRKTKVVAAVKWVKASPLAGKPLVKTHVEVLADEVVRIIQMTVAPPTSIPAVELENVPPGLLLPPFMPGPEQVKMAVQGGNFSLGDRVTCLLKAGIPAFGLHGTVISVFEEAIEVVFDREFVGGTDLGGKVKGRCGAVLPKDILLNCNQPVQMPINKTHVPRAAAGTAVPPPARPTSAQAPKSSQQSAAVAAAFSAARAASARVPTTAKPSSGNGAASRTVSDPATAVQRALHHHAVPVTAAVGGAGPPPPLPSASMFALAQGKGSNQAGSGHGHVNHHQHAHHQHHHQQAAAPNPGNQLLQKLQSGGSKTLPRPGGPPPPHGPPPPGHYTHPTPPPHHPIPHPMGNMPPPPLPHMMPPPPHMGPPPPGLHPFGFPPGVLPLPVHQPHGPPPHFHHPHMPHLPHAPVHHHPPPQHQHRGPPPPAAAPPPPAAPEAAAPPANRAPKLLVPSHVLTTPPQPKRTS